LNIYSTAVSVPGGSSGQLQYNNAGILSGVPNVTYTSGNLSLGNVSNVRINGGVNGYFLQTDGTGNLTWAVGGGGGNGSPGGSNTQIQFNDNGVFGGNVGFTFNKTTGDVAVPANLTVTGTLNANIGAPGNTTEIVFNQGGAFATNANLKYSFGSLNVSNGAVIADSFTGNAANMFSINGGNVTGNVPSSVLANVANFAGSVTTNAQPNITSVGTLSSLTVTGNINAGNVSATLLGGTLTTPAQTSVTSLGVLTDISTTGTTSIYEAIENVAIIGAQTGTYNYNFLDGAIQYSTANATANVTLNFRGNSGSTLNSVLGNAKSATATYVMTTGTTGYAVNAVQIDSSAQTIKWVNGSTPALNSNSVTAFTFTLIKTSTTPTYTVLGSATRYA